MSDPFQFGIEDVDAGPDNRTIGEALADIAVERCLSRDPKCRTPHVRAQFLYMANRDKVLGRAVAEANRPAGESDGVTPSLGDWEAAFFRWATDFYPRMAAVRGLRMPSGVVRVRALAFARALVAEIRYLEQWCLGAGSSDHPPVFEHVGPGDPLLQEPASGRRRDAHAQ